jgi:hypothetical protein
MHYALCTMHYALCAKHYSIHRDIQACIAPDRQRQAPGPLPLWSAPIPCSLPLSATPCTYPLSLFFVPIPCPYPLPLSPAPPVTMGGTGRGRAGSAVAGKNRHRALSVQCVSPTVALCAHCTALLSVCTALLSVHSTERAAIARCSPLSSCILLYLRWFSLGGTL